MRVHVPCSSRTATPSTPFAAYTRKPCGRREHGEPTGLERRSARAVALGQLAQDLRRDRPVRLPGVTSVDAAVDADSVCGNPEAGRLDAVQTVSMGPPSGSARSLDASASSATAGRGCSTVRWGRTRASPRSRRHEASVVDDEQPRAVGLGAGLVAAVARTTRGSTTSHRRSRRSGRRAWRLDDRAGRRTTRAPAPAARGGPSGRPARGSGRRRCSARTRRGPPRSRRLHDREHRTRRRTRLAVVPVRARTSMPTSRAPPRPSARRAGEARRPARRRPTACRSTRCRARP